MRERSSASDLVAGCTKIENPGTPNQEATIILMNPAALFLKTKSKVFNPNAPDHEMWEILSLWAEGNQLNPDYILFRTRWLLTSASDYRNRKSVNREEDQAIADALQALRSIKERIGELDERTSRIDS